MFLIRTLIIGAIICLIDMISLAYLAWQYVYGSGYGLNPIAVGVLIAMLAIAMFILIRGIRIERRELRRLRGVIVPNARRS
jgi:uncharacterized membrane protein